MTDRGPTVVNTGGGGGGGGWAVAVILAVVVIVGALWLFGGLNFGGSDGNVDVTVDTPDISVEEPAGDAGGAPAGDAGGEPAAGGGEPAADAPASE